MIREWKDMTQQIELRCFVHNQVLQGVSLDINEDLTDSPQITEDYIINKLKKLQPLLNNFVRTVTINIPYDDYIADISISKTIFDNITTLDSEQISSKDIWLIEINTPVYLLATSGNFNLANSNHINYLFKTNDMIDYPIILCNYNHSLIEYVNYNNN